MKRIILLSVTLTFLTILSCCKKDAVRGIYNSGKATMGAGTVYSWVNFDKNSNPLSFGLTLNDAALTNLPVSNNNNSGHNHHNSIELTLPSEANLITPFNHIVIDWNPDGHEPKPIYAAPHFDFHFYMMTSADRKKIPSYAQDSTGFSNRPSSEYFPPNYFNPPLVVSSDPQMGTHWVDANSPELQPGGVFTETFVYGSFNGKVNFIEPMITYDFFKNITEWSRTIPQPAKVQLSGYYPTKLSISHLNGEYILSLEDLIYREAN
ncbi:MAG: DUF5602 domain-containing protein [Bacteroidetes bacterium]|nr:DUF5602 domain-containing protein [Bacteroidota bacterium]